MERNNIATKIKGSLIGGAIGDALGYAVEFTSWNGIRREYGDGGIQSYDLKFGGGVAIFSDDTQMSLFTANGILNYETARRLGDVQGSVVDYVYVAYEEWLKTQWAGGVDLTLDRRCWLYEVAGLHENRAPGGTCLSALGSGTMGTVANPINSSKGCGGVMRVAPLALCYKPKDAADQCRLDRIGTDIAAITRDVLIEIANDLFVSTV